MNRENEYSSSSSQKGSSVWWSPKLDEEIPSINNPYTLTEGHRERIQRRVNELGKLIREIHFDQQQQQQQQQQQPRRRKDRSHRHRHRIAWGDRDDVEHPSEKCYFGDNESTDSDSDSDSDSDESTVDSLVLTRERFAKNAAEKSGISVVLPPPVGQDRRRRRRQYRRERRKMWRDAAALHIRPLQQEQEDIEKKNGDGDDGEHGEGRQVGDDGPHLKRRSLFRRAVQRDSMSLTRERLPDLVHDFSKHVTKDEDDGDDDDNASTTSESTGIDSLVLARARHVPRLIIAPDSSEGGPPAEAASSASASAKPLQYRVQKYGTDRNGKVVWDLSEDISKSEHQRLEEGMLKDGPRGGVNCAA